jgi:hypothetical protein
MKELTKKLLSATILMGLAMPLTAMATDQDIQQKIDALTKEVDALKQQTKKTEEKSLGRWLTIGGDYRFRYDYLKGKVAPYADFNRFMGALADPNSMAGIGAALMTPGVGVPEHSVENKSLYTNRFGLDLKAKATKDVSVTARLLMYKVAGAQDDNALRGNDGTAFSFDRAGLFDGTIGHVPGDSKLAVDRVYATWNNIAGQPVWFSIGRRPSTGGVPGHLRQDNEKPGNSGVPSLLIDYAFDGVTLGYAPDIDALPGAYAKFCYGRGFSTGINDVTSDTAPRNMDLMGLNIVPYDTDPLRIELQYNRAFNIFNAPNMLSGPFASTIKTNGNLGDMDAYGLDFLGKVKKVGFGDLNWFVDGSFMQTHNNGHAFIDLPGLLAGSSPGLMFNGTPRDVNGWAVFVGGRYDILDTGTKIGFEFNHGSKNWLTFSPAADDMWTSKVGTRGNVYEGYIIQELKLQPISSYLSKVFFKVGYQYYDFDYTGSNSWIGAPVKISDLTTTSAQFTAPLKTAQDLYATFEVHF